MAGLLAVVLAWPGDDSSPAADTERPSANPTGPSGQESPDSDNPAPSTGPTSSPTDSAPSGTPSPGELLIPEAFVGTWTGGGVGTEAGRFRLTVTIPETQPRGVLAATADILSPPCRQRWELREADADRLVLRSTLARGPCTAEVLRVTATLDGDELAVEWTDEQGNVVYQAVLRTR